jgi:CRISPR system Cascade subunit CasD
MFIVALEGEKSLIQKIETALKHPVYPLYLGRRACPPSGEIVLEVCEESIDEALRSYAWQAEEWYRKNQPETLWLEIVWDADIKANGGEVIRSGKTFEARDLPVTFSQSYRRYAYRSVISELDAVEIHNEFSYPARRKQGKLVDGYSEMQVSTHTEHNAFDEVGY